MSRDLRQHIEQIVSLTDKEFEFVKSHFTKKKLKKHQFLIQANEPVLYDYWVANGLVKAYQNDDTGKEHVLSFAMEEWWVSDYAAFFTQTNATLNVDCLEDTEVLCLSYDNRTKLCQGLQKMEHFFLRKSNSGYVAQQRRILSLLSNNAKERYEQFLALYPTLQQRLPKTLIAAYLGVSRETLSRLFIS